MDHVLAGLQSAPEGITSSSSGVGAWPRSTSPRTSGRRNILLARGHARVAETIGGQATVPSSLLPNKRIPFGAQEARSSKEASMATKPIDQQKMEQFVHRVIGDTSALTTTVLGAL